MIETFPATPPTLINHMDILGRLKFTMEEFKFGT